MYFASSSFSFKFYNRPIWIIIRPTVGKPACSSNIFSPICLELACVCVCFQMKLQFKSDIQNSHDLSSSIHVPSQNSWPMWTTDAPGFYLDVEPPLQFVYFLKIFYCEQQAIWHFWTKTFLISSILFYLLWSFAIPFWRRNHCNDHVMRCCWLQWRIREYPLRPTLG